MGTDQYILEPCTCVFRHGENDFTLWDVDLPHHVIAQIKSGYRQSAEDVETLLEHLPQTDSLPENTVSLLVWNQNELSLYTATLDDTFTEEYDHTGSSLRADLNVILDELEGPEEEIEIMWDDLKPEMQRRILRMYGENCNYDVFPITTLYAPGMEQNMAL